MREITQNRIDKLDRLFESYAMVAEGTDVYVCDVKYDYSRWSKSAIELYGLSSEYMYAAGEIWEQYIHPKDRTIYRESINEIMTTGEGRHDVQYRVKDISGKYDTCTCRGVIIRDDNNEPEYFVGMIRNHSINGCIDNITGLRNQNGFFHDVNRYLKSHIPFKIVMYGSTNYTRINDLFGYDFGTRIMRHVMKFMVDHDKDMGDMYRLDGVRIAMITRDVTMEELEKNYEYYRERASRSFLFEGENIKVNINAGAIAVDSFDVDSDTILSCLMHAYKESKYNKQGKFCVFDTSINKNSIYELERINSIRRCVADSCRNFIIYYQPILDAGSEKLAGAEALIRWKDEDGNVVPPNDFIPILENDALFPELGEWIMRRSMEQCLDIVKADPGFILNINLSYAQLQQINFINVVTRALEDTGYPAENLCFEITERCRLLDHDMLKDISFNLKEKGIRIALDDFGTGFSSLELLQDMYIDVIKIDKQFVKNIVSDEKQLSLIKLVNRMSEIFGAVTCAEGVETVEMRDILRQCEVHKMQGYLYSKPVPMEDFIYKFIERN
ncbi:PAS domain S-box [Lachnospiraceae bacterium JC7]|nr:PAS domain S-box [Lachnospiraceae bacterium JC7]